MIKTSYLSLYIDYKQNMVALLLPVCIVYDAMAVASVDNTDNHDGHCSAEDLLETFFQGDFMTCMEKSHKY